MSEERKCPICNALVDKEGFRDEESKKACDKNGLCQTCQDVIFEGR